MSSYDLLLCAKWTVGNCEPLTAGVGQMMNIMRTTCWRRGTEVRWAVSPSFCSTWLGWDCSCFVFCLFLFVWSCLVVFVLFVGCFGVVCVFCCTSCLTPTFFTQKLWSSSPVSVKGRWTCASTHVTLRLEF